MKLEEVLKIVSYIDLTSLNSTDNDATITSLINKGNSGIANQMPAAICVYPNLTSSLSLIDSRIKKAVVAGFFPESQASLEAKANELLLINSLLIDEVDIVINRGKIIEGDFEYLSKEISQARKILKDKKLKVILETGELRPDEIKKSSEIAIHCGADFIKTSTGKSKIGATPEAVQIMCSAILGSNKKVGIKVSGGVKTLDDAILYKNIIFQAVGEKWLSPELFRIGASSLYDNISKDINSYD